VPGGRSRFPRKLRTAIVVLGTLIAVAVVTALTQSGGPDLHALHAPASIDGLGVVPAPARSSVEQDIVSSLRSAISGPHFSRELFAVYGSAQAPGDFLVVAAAEPAHFEAAEYSKTLPGFQARTIVSGGEKYRLFSQPPATLGSTSIISWQVGDVILELVSVPSRSSASMLRDARSLQSGLGLG